MMLRVSLGLLLAFVVGCSGSERPTGSGAKEAALAYYDALIHKDFTSAYDVVDGKVTRQAFEQFARRYLRGIGFEPSSVVVRACEERDDEATVHVFLRGRSKHARPYKDAVVLRKNDGNWKVVMPGGH